MKKIVTVLLTLTLLLCACTPISSGGDTTTTAYGDPPASSGSETAATAPEASIAPGTEPTETEYVVVYPPWPIEGTVSEELRREIKQALSDKEGIDHTGHTDYDPAFVCGMLWCGNYNGYDLLIDICCPDAGNDNMCVDGVNFSYAQIVYAYKDGVFHSLQNIYASGILSKAELETLAKIDSEWKFAKRKSFVPDGLTDALRKEVCAAYAKYTGEDRFLTYTDGLPGTICGMTFLGIHDGYVILPPHRADLGFPGYEKIGIDYFYSGTGEAKLAYRDGEFKKLKEVYEAGDISLEAIAHASEIAFTISPYFG